MTYKLLHAHGTAGPKGKRSYLQFGTYKTKSAAQKAAREYNLDNKKIVPKTKVSLVKQKGAKGLYYIKK